MTTYSIRLTPTLLALYRVAISDYLFITDSIDSDGYRPEATNDDSTRLIIATGYSGWFVGRHGVKAFKELKERLNQ